MCELAPWTGVSMSISKNDTVGQRIVVSLDTPRFELKINGVQLAGTGDDLNGALTNLDWTLRGATVEFFLKDSGKKDTWLSYVDPR